MQERWLEELRCVLKCESRLRGDGMEKVWEFVCVHEFFKEMVPEN